MIFVPFSIIVHKYIPLSLVTKADLKIYTAPQTLTCHSHNLICKTVLLGDDLLKTLVLPSCYFLHPKKIKTDKIMVSAKLILSTGAT